MLPKILLLLRTLVPLTKRNRNQTQIISLYFCFLVLISPILFWQGYKGYPGPPGHPGDQVSFPSRGALRKDGFAGCDAGLALVQPPPPRAAHTRTWAHTDPASMAWWEETALELLNLISNFYCSATLFTWGKKSQLIILPLYLSFYINFTWTLLTTLCWVYVIPFPQPTPPLPFSPPSLFG